MSHAEDAPTLYGLMAEFDNPTALVRAAEQARLAGVPQLLESFAQTAPASTGE